MISPEILNTTHIECLKAHFLRLSDEDRLLRFGNYCTNETLVSYLSSINFVKDRIFGIWAKDVLVAVGHLAFYNSHNVADISLSVDSRYRGKGFGQALVNQAKLITQALRYSQLKISCLHTNSPMIYIAVKNGFRKQTCEDGEWEGSLFFIA